MTVNKFGYYFYIKTQEHKLTAPLPAEEVSFKKVCMFNIRDKLKKGSAINVLDNNSNSDTSKLSSKIQHLDISTNLFLKLQSRRVLITFS